MKFATRAVSKYSHASSTHDHIVDAISSSMPLRGETHSDLVKDEAPYFESLAELDAWFTQPHDKLLGVLPYQPRPRIDDHSDSRAKLLVGRTFNYLTSESDPLTRFVTIIKSVVHPTGIYTTVMSNQWVYDVTR